MAVPFGGVGFILAFVVFMGMPFPHFLKCDRARMACPLLCTCWFNRKLPLTGAASIALQA